MKWNSESYNKQGNKNFQDFVSVDSVCGNEMEKKENFDKDGIQSEKTARVLIREANCPMANDALMRR